MERIHGYTRFKPENFNAFMTSRVQVCNTDNLSVAVMAPSLSLTGARALIGVGVIFIYSGSARLVSFEILS